MQFQIHIGIEIEEQKIIQNFIFRYISSEQNCFEEKIK